MISVNTKKRIKGLLPDFIYYRFHQICQFSRVTYYNIFIETHQGISLIKAILLNSFYVKNKCFKQILNNRFPKIYKEYRYGQLEKYTDHIDRGDAILLMKNIFKHNCLNLSEKSKISVGFLVYSSREWQCENIYRMMEKDDKFEPYVIVCGYTFGTEYSIRDTYEDTCSFFEHKGTYNVKKIGYDRLTTFGVQKDYGRQEVDLDSFDILFQSTPGDLGMIPEYSNIKYRKLNQLVVFIQYSYQLVDQNHPWNSKVSHYLDSTVFKMSWKYYCGSKREYEMMRDETRLGDYNAVLCGLPKVDELIDKTYVIRDSLWRTSERTKYKIIWAPHFNMKDGMNGTFNENYEWLYDYALRHPETSWIIRPHPRMYWGVKEYNIFENEEDYNSYLDKWDSLDNARVIAYGDYYDIFDTSDAMILDSISFIAEYLYTKKPMLFLLSKNPRPLNPLGEAIRRSLYNVRGNDFEGIERFIDKTILEDPKLPDREEVLRNMLDCRKYTKVSASQYAFDDIKKELSKS